MQHSNNRDEFVKLLKKYLEGDVTPEEKQFVELYYDHFEMEPDVLAGYSQHQKQHLEERMADSLQQKIESNQLLVKPLWKTWHYAAASVLILLSIGLYFTLKEKPRMATLPKAASKVVDIAPGSNKAMLTLGDGSQIALDDAAVGILAEEGNVVVNKTRDGQLLYEKQAKKAAPRYNTISTPAGGQFNITLPDGSKVWLNALSSVAFPTVFSEDERKVKVTGEVYFEIARNPKQPFLVNVGDKQDIRVLGTHFNVNSYQDEVNIRTTLLEGSVQIFSPNSLSGPIHLKPGQQAEATSSGKIQIKNNVNTQDVIAWKNGFFRFENTDLKAVMRQLARWYDVEVEYEGVVPGRHFSGKIHRNLNASQALDILSFTGIHFRIERQSASSKNKIIVTP